MNRTLSAIAVLALMSMSTSAPFAHHSAVMFDNSAPVTIKGTLRRVEIVAPHSLLYVEQETIDGPIVWAIEGPAPNGLFRRGFASDDFKVGDTFEACGYVLKDNVPSLQDGSRRLLTEVLVMPDGAAHVWSPYGNEHCRAGGGYTIVE